MIILTIIGIGGAAFIIWLVTGKAAEHIGRLHDSLMTDEDIEQIEKHRTGEWD